MSFTEGDGKIEQFIESKSSGNEDNHQTDEDIISEESFLGSCSSFKYCLNKNNHATQKMKKNIQKCKSCRLTVSLRYKKFKRPARAKIKSQKISQQKKRKKLPEKNQVCSEKPAEIKKGKRCRLGGKSKGKPPQEEGREKFDSDDDSDSLYFGRISLGYFQKYKDKSGASTSCQKEEDYKDAVPLNNTEEIEEVILNNPSEEFELLELQKWGKAALVSSIRTTDFEKA